MSAATFDRTHNPARGREGGRPGAAGAARLSGGRVLAGKAVHEIPGGERLVVELPGGGGLGDPRERGAELVEADLDAGYITEHGARSEYGFERVAPRASTVNGQTGYPQGEDQ